MNSAMFLLYLSFVLTVVFFLAIVATSLYAHIRLRKETRIQQQLGGMIAQAFSLDEERRGGGTELLRQYVGRSASRREQLIHVLLRKGFAADSAGATAALVEATGIDSYIEKLFSSGRAYKQMLACRYAGELRLESMKERIYALSGSRSNDVIYNVLLALAKLGDSKGLSDYLRANSGKMSLSFRAIVEVISVFAGSKEQLIKEAIEDSDDYLKGVLIKAAAEEKCEGLSSYYVKYLNSSDKNLRIACIRALAEHPGDTHEQYIIAMLRDKDWEVRASAAKSLAKIGTDKSFTPLEQMVNDKEWWVRHNAASALVTIPGGKQYARRIVNGSDQFARDAIARALDMTS